MAIEVEIAKVRKQPQVRQNLDLETIQGLAASIAEVGQLHPIIVQPDGDGYLLVAGERRLEAMKMLGRATISAVIWEGKASAREVQLIENIQREDVDPVSKAVAIAELVKSEGLSKKDVATRLGLPRTTVTDWLDMIEIRKKYQELVVENFRGGSSCITPSHVSIALGVASKRGKPAVAYQILDAALKHSLTKSQLQELARTMIENTEMTVRQALKQCVKTRQQKKGGNGEAAAAVNVEMLVAALGRWRSQLSRIHGVTVQEITPENREHLMGQLTAIRKSIESLLGELKAQEKRPAGTAGPSTHPEGQGQEVADGSRAAAKLAGRVVS